MGEFIELIFGLAMLGFILFMVIGIPMTIIADSKKPKARRKRPQPRQEYYSADFTPREFDFYHESERGEFYVYFIANERLSALKIGVGNTGRIKQLLHSYTQKDESSEGIGWEILKVAQFSDQGTDFEAGKRNGNEAERRAHYYWRYVLNLPLYLSEDQMGYSRIRKNDQTIWVLTPGYTETAIMHKVCEVSTWNYVVKTPGFIRESNAFSGINSRELRLLHENHRILEIPHNYENFKLAKINHVNPKAIESRRVAADRSQDSGTKIIPTKPSKADLNVQQEIEPYTSGGIGIYPCTTPSCKWPSASMFASSKCEKCSKE
jgi:hypothetical protein